MKSRLYSILKFGLFFGVGVFLSWWSIHKLSDKDYQDFLNSLKTANYFLFIPVFFILTISHISRAIRWKILMKSMGYYPKLSNTFCAVMVGYLANLAFPRLGEVLKCTILSKYEKVPPEKLVGTILVERAVDMLSFFIVIIFALITQAKIVGTYAKEKLSNYFLQGSKYAAIFKLLFIAFLIYLIIVGVKYFFKKYPNNKIVFKLNNIINGISVGLLSVKNLKSKWRFILHSIIIWLCYIVGTYIGFLAIKETAILPMLAAFPVVCFGTVAMILSPGGIGFYPVFLMEAMSLYNIQESFGKANGWLQWSAQFVIILIVGFICLAFLPYINKFKNESNTNTH